jgi:hypothetical protein
MMTYVVELMVFTGRANPRVVLTAREAAGLRALIETLNVPAMADTRPRLGYRGALVYAWSGPTGGWQPWVSVSNRLATMLQGPNAGRTFRAEAVEQHLLRVARRAGLGSVLEQAFPSPTEVRDDGHERNPKPGR